MIDYIFFLIGIITVIIALVLLNKNVNTESDSEYLEGNSITDIELLRDVQLAENVIEELREISENTIEDMDIKVKEAYKMLRTMDKKIEEYKALLEKKDVIDQSEHIKEDHINNEEVDKILRLRNQGLSPSQIAKQLDKGIGEIQLICNLKKR